MAAKVKWDRGAWWVVVHHQGRRRKRRLGPTAADKRRADRIAERVNRRDLVSGSARFEDKPPTPLRCDAHLRRWLTTYSPTFKPSTEAEASRIIEKYLVPFFGSADLRELREANLLEFIQAKLDAGLAPKTIHNALSVLRRVLTPAGSGQLRAVVATHPPPRPEGGGSPPSAALHATHLGQPRPGLRQVGSLGR
jgi:hypothetical protein